MYRFDNVTQLPVAQGSRSSLPFSRASYTRWVQLRRPSPYLCMGTLFNCLAVRQRGVMCQCQCCGITAVAVTADHLLLHPASRLMRQQHGWTLPASTGRALKQHEQSERVGIFQSLTKSLTAVLGTLTLCAGGGVWRLLPTTVEVHLAIEVPAVAAALAQAHCTSATGHFKSSSRSTQLALKAALQGQ
jgi:hypothetical protein